MMSQSLITRPIKVRFILCISTFLLSIGLSAFWTILFAASSATTATSTTKQELEAKGLIFVTSHEEIVANARKEGQLRLSSFLDGEGRRAMAEAFRRKYPFIEISMEEIGGTDEYQRFIPELKAGRIKLDVTHIPNHFYEEYLPYLKKFDIRGMAEQRILQIPAQQVDSVNRYVVAMATNIAVVAYNNKALSSNDVPDTWEGFLGPRFKGKKFVADIRPLGIAGLVPAWGLEKTVEFAKKIAAQDPVWTRGGTRALASLATGEYSMLMGFNYGSVKRAQDKDPTQSIASKILEPVPVRFAGMGGIVATANHPYSSLLWLEFQVSPEGQKIVDKHWPYGASVFVPGAAQEELIRGRKLSVMSWERRQEMDDWLTKVVQALGFPTGDTKN